MHRVQNKCSLWSRSLSGLCVCFMSVFRVMSDLNSNEDRLRVPGVCVSLVLTCNKIPATFAHRAVLRVFPEQREALWRRLVIAPAELLNMNNMASVKEDC